MPAAIGQDHAWRWHRKGGSHYVMLRVGSRAPKRDIQLDYQNTLNGLVDSPWAGHLLPIDPLNEGRHLA